MLWSVRQWPAAVRLALLWAALALALTPNLLGASPNERPPITTGNNNNSSLNNNPQHLANAKQIEQMIFREYRQRFQVNKAISDRAYYSLLAVYSLFVLAGTLGNLLICLTVLLNPKVLSPRNIFIVNLASSDLLLCVFTMPFSFIEITMKVWDMGLLSCKLVACLQSTSILVSTFSITAIALDRYRVIVYPTNQEGQYSMRRAGLMLASVWLGALFISLPLFLVRTLYHRDLLMESKRMPNTSLLHIPASVAAAAAASSVTDAVQAASLANASNTSSTTAHLDEVPDSIDYCIEAWPFNHGRGIYSIVLMILQYVLPITVVSIVYAMISDKLRKRLLKRQKSSQLQCQQKRRLHLIKRTHVMLFSVSLIFGLSWLPFHLINVICDFSDLTMSFDDQMYRLVFAVCTLIGCSSACTNPILYGYLNENFRKEMHQVYRHYARHLFALCPIAWRTGASSAFGTGSGGAGRAGPNGPTTGNSSSSFQDSSMGSQSELPEEQPEDWLLEEASERELSQLALNSPSVAINSQQLEDHWSALVNHTQAASAASPVRASPPPPYTSGCPHSRPPSQPLSPPSSQPMIHTGDDKSGHFKRTGSGCTQVHQPDMSLLRVEDAHQQQMRLGEDQRRCSYQTSASSGPPGRYKLGRTMRICLCISGASSNDTLNASNEPAPLATCHSALWSAPLDSAHFRRPPLSPAASGSSITRSLMKGGSTSGSKRAPMQAAATSSGASVNPKKRSFRRRRQQGQKRSCECICHKATASKAASLAGSGSSGLLAKRRTTSVRLNPSNRGAESLRQRADSAGARLRVGSPGSCPQSAAMGSQGAPTSNPGEHLQRTPVQTSSSAVTARATNTDASNKSSGQQGRRVWLHYLLRPSSSSCSSSSHKHNKLAGSGPQEQVSMASLAGSAKQLSSSSDCCKKCGCSLHQPHHHHQSKRTPANKCQQPNSAPATKDRVQRLSKGAQKEKQQPKLAPSSQKSSWPTKQFQLKSVNDPSAYYLTIDTGCQETSLSKGCSTSVLALAAVSDLEEEQVNSIVYSRQRRSTCTDNQKVNNNGTQVDDNNNNLIKGKRTTSAELYCEENKKRNQHVIEVCDGEPLKGSKEEDESPKRGEGEKQLVAYSASHPSSLYACIHSSGSISTCTCSSEFSLSCYKHTPATCDQHLLPSGKRNHLITSTQVSPMTNNNCAGSLTRIDLNTSNLNQPTTRSCSVSGATPTSLSGELACSWASFQSSASLEVARLTAAAGAAGSSRQVEEEEEDEPHHLDLKEELEVGQMGAQDKRVGLGLPRSQRQQQQ